MNAMQVLDVCACSLILLGCVHIADKAGSFRRPFWRFASYEMYRFGYVLIGGFAACNLLGMIPAAADTAIEYKMHWPGVLMRAGLAVVFLGRLVRTVFGGAGCLARR